MRVSCDTGRPLADVAEDSYALTLYTWGRRLAEEKRHRLLRQGESIGDALRTAIAFHEPKRLQTEVRDYELSIGLGADTVTTDPSFIEKAKAFLLNGEQMLGGAD